MAEMSNRKHTEVDLIKHNAYGKSVDTNALDFFCVKIQQNSVKTFFLDIQNRK